LNYVIDPRLPFVLGTGAFLVLLVATIWMRDVVHHETTRKIQWRGLIALERLSIANLTLFLAIVFFGVVGAVYFSFDIVTIALNKLGLQSEYLGWVFAAASLVGAVLGLVVHKLKHISLGSYMLIDVGILLLVYIAGYSANLGALIVAAVLSISFWRYRTISYQDHLLSRFQGGFKSTLLSVMSTTENLNMLWVPIATTAVVGGFGIVHGFGLLGLAIGMIGILYIGLMYKAFLTKANHKQYN
jgi:hypothetical protein